MVDAYRMGRQGMEEIWGKENNTEENLKAYAFYAMNIEEDQVWFESDSLIDRLRDHQL